MSKKHIIITLFIILILGVGIFSVVQIYKMNRSKPISGTPTVFVHGYKGTYNSLNNMLLRLEVERDLGQKVLTYRVSKKGKLSVDHSGLKNVEPAYIQVVFEDNRAHFEESAQWLSSVLNDLKMNYHVDQANLLGHSMGGIVSLKFIEDYQNENEYPEIKKLVTLGSPFDGIYSEEYFQTNRDAAAFDLQPDSPALNLLRKNKKSFPDSIDVLSVGSTGDMVARPDSVKSIKDIVKKENVTEVIIQDKKLGHSALHENEAIDKLVYEFLYSDIESGKTVQNHLQ